MANPWKRDILNEDLLDREAQIMSELRMRANLTGGVSSNPVQPVTLRVLESLVHEFEQAGVDMIPVSHLRTVINKIKAEEAQRGKA